MHSVHVRKEIDCTYALAGIVQQGFPVGRFRTEFGMTENEFGNEAAIRHSEFISGGGESLSHLDLIQGVCEKACHPELVSGSFYKKILQRNCQ